MISPKKIVTLTLVLGLCLNLWAAESKGPMNITLPGLFDDQGTCYAAYHFLEHFCGVRWYGPTELNIVF